MPYSIQALAPQLIPVLDSQQADGKKVNVPYSTHLAFLGSWATEPVGGYTTESVTHGQCDARPITVTFPASEHLPLWPVPIYTAWWTEAHVCEQLTQICYVNQSGRDSNLRPNFPPDPRLHFKPQSITALCQTILLGDKGACMCVVAWKWNYQ